VNHGNPEPRINPLLSEAYAALQAGRLDVARQLYESVARADPGSIDAQLGLAAIAMQQGKTEEATRHYMAILRLDPRHALAQSGLIALAGRADPLASETRLKQLIARDPSPFLYFTLGNLYADQGLWAQAQQAYFQAHHLEPGNPDYAFNLAVGLEHLSQPRLALDFYRRAVELARARGHANFDVEQAQARADKLAAQAE
jgi:tetratricopeptide (TPR) repeat protein